MNFYKIKEFQFQKNAKDINEIKLSGFNKRSSKLNQAQLKTENRSESNKYLLKYQIKKKKENGSSFTIGDQVMLCNLNKKKLNGFRGIVVGYLEETRRFCIKIENFKKSISVKPENIVQRFYGTQVCFPCCLSKQIQSIKDIFANWRDVTFSQIKHWYSISCNEKPLEKHLKNCYKRIITLLDVKKWNDYDLLTFFSKFDLLFTCTRCIQFKVLTSWKIVKQTTKVWFEFSNLLFSKHNAKLLKEWLLQYNICLKLFNECFQLIAGRKRTNDMFKVEVAKQLNYSDAVLPPFRCLSDKSLQTLEVCLKSYFKSALQMLHISVGWRPNSKELGINTKIKYN